MRVVKAEKREQKRKKAMKRMTSLSDQLKLRRPKKSSPSVHVTRKKT